MKTAKKKTQSRWGKHAAGVSRLFRRTYRKLSPDEIAHVAEIKLKAEMLYELLDATAPRADDRAMTFARMKLEECVMWATKAIT